MRSFRMVIWVIPIILYVLFWSWYTPLSGPLTPEEIDDFLATAEANGADAKTIDRVRRFVADDDGRQFLMLNIIDMADEPAELPATGPGADARDLLGHYMEYMYPELFKRACHPVFAGRSLFEAMDLVGIEGAENWDTAAIMRYRSRRDMLEITFNPVFNERHDYKVVAMEKTIAFPTSPVLYMNDPRFLLALILLALTGLVDVILVRR